MFIKTLPFNNRLFYLQTCLPPNLQHFPVIHHMQITVILLLTGNVVTMCFANSMCSACSTHSSLTCAMHLSSEQMLLSMSHILTTPYSHLHTAALPKSYDCIHEVYVINECFYHVTVESVFVHA